MVVGVRVSVPGQPCAVNDRSRAVAAITYVVSDDPMGRYVEIAVDESLRFLEPTPASRAYDPDFRNTKRVTDSEVETLVSNVYKVLLTRGMRGTLVYSVDGETHRRLCELAQAHGGVATYELGAVSRGGNSSG